MTTHMDMSSTSEFYTEPRGTFFNAFTDFEELASSKYTTVVKARKNGKWFVLKALNEEYRGKSQYEMLLKKEYAIGFKFDHPNIVRYIDFVTLGNLGNCIQMEYIVGQSLGKFLKTSPTLNAKKKLVLQLVSGLRAIHAEQVVHRDLKPENILITENGHNVKIIDFGFSDADSYSILKEPAGTEGFSAPEQTLGTQPLDNRADIYSFGIILKKIGLPFYYKNTIERCSKEDRDKRYNTIEEFAKAFVKQRKKLIFVTCIIIILISVVPILSIHKFISTAELENNTSFPIAIENKKEEQTKNVVSTHAVVTPNKDTSKHEKVVMQSAQQTHSSDSSSEEFQPLDIFAAQLHNGIDSILNPYIERRKAGINIAEHQTFMHQIERKAQSFHTTFFSRNDFGGLKTILLQEYDRYFNVKFGEYCHAGKVRGLTSKERREIIRRQLPQLRKLQDSLYGKHRQDTMVGRP